MAKPEYFPVRYLVLAMFFTCCMYSYVGRVNLSIAILPMSNITDRKVQTPQCGYKAKGRVLKNQGARYEMTEMMQGNLLASYFYGLTCTCILGGFLAERFGPLNVIGVTMIIQTIVTGVTPLIAKYYYALMFSRVIVGMMGGIHFPAVQSAIARWAPPNEKNKFVFAIQGGTFGSVITWPIIAPVIETWNWEASFYATAISNAIWLVAWYLFVSDFPEKHMFISAKEKDFIIESQGGAVSRAKKKKIPPYKKIFSDRGVWAMVIAQFGNQWGLYLLMSAGPKFLSTVQGFPLTSSGILAATPYLCRLAVAFTSANVSDILKAKNLATTRAIRLYGTIVSHILPGMILVCMWAAQCNEKAAVSILALSMAFNGVTTVTHLANAQDITPNFAGSVYGIMNCIGGTTGFITPYITAALIKGHNTVDRWGYNYIIGGTAYIISGIIFMLLQKTDIQPWNEIAATDAPAEPTEDPKAAPAK